MNVNSSSLIPVGRTSGTVTVKKVNFLRLSVYFLYKKTMNTNVLSSFDPSGKDE